MTHRVGKPRPIGALLGGIKKFSHLNKEEIGRLEKEAEERYQLIEDMAEKRPLRGK
jgi:hypothetical protein